MSSSSPDTLVYAEDLPSPRVLRFPGRKFARAFLDDANGPSPMDSVQSLPQELDESAFADVAVIPDIPLRRSSRRPSVTDDRDDGVRTPVTSPQHAVMERVVMRNHGFTVPRHGPINPNSVHLRLDNSDFDEGVDGLQDHQAPERAETPPVGQRNYAPSVARSAGTKSRASSALSTRLAEDTSLPPLQMKGAGDVEGLEPLAEEEIEPGSFDLVPPVADQAVQYSLEKRSEQLFSKDHLAVMFSEPGAMRRFTSFLSMHRPFSLPLLIYYFDALKARKAVEYSNAVLEALQTLEEHDFTREAVRPTENDMLAKRVDAAFEALARDELPAYITHIWIQIVSTSMRQRITGTMPPRLVTMSEGLAEVFCLTDPSRKDNPIIFASEGFHRTTQYGMDYVIGRNCRFLQGPKTNPFSVKRIRDTLAAGKEHYETFLNYRRDGSPFMNLLMCAPLFDSRGNIRYFIGAQVDVSGLAKECAGLESLQRLVERQQQQQQQNTSAADDAQHTKTSEAGPDDEFRDLSSMFNLDELETVRKHGGTMHRARPAVAERADATPNWHQPRIVIRDEESLLLHHPHPHYHNSNNNTRSSTPLGRRRRHRPAAAADDHGPTMMMGMMGGGRLAGVYDHYLLVRPHPNLRILFASPSLRIPGILQSPFLSKIGGSSPRVREELARAFAAGTGVITARVRWVSSRGGGSGLNADEGRPRWIHCTPLLGSNGAVGVWMVVLLDDDDDADDDSHNNNNTNKYGNMQRQQRKAPPVDARLRPHHQRHQRRAADMWWTSDDDNADADSISMMSNGGGGGGSGMYEEHELRRPLGSGAGSGRHNLRQDPRLAAVGATDFARSGSRPASPYTLVEG